MFVKFLMIFLSILQTVNQGTQYILEGLGRGKVRLREWSTMNTYVCISSSLSSVRTYVHPVIHSLNMC